MAKRSAQKRDCKSSANIGFEAKARQPAPKARFNSSRGQRHGSASTTFPKTLKGRPNDECPSYQGSKYFAGHGRSEELSLLYALNS